MTWSLRKPDVRLRVTRFALEKPIAGLSTLQRTALRLRRARECRKIVPRDSAALVTGSVKARPTF